MKRIRNRTTEDWNRTWRRAAEGDDLIGPQEVSCKRDAENVQGTLSCMFSMLPCLCSPGSSSSGSAEAGQWLWLSKAEGLSRIENNARQCSPGIRVRKPSKHKTKQIHENHQVSGHSLNSIKTIFSFKWCNHTFSDWNKLMFIYKDQKGKCGTTGWSSRGL